MSAFIRSLRQSSRTVLRAGRTVMQSARTQTARFSALPVARKAATAVTMTGAGLLTVAGTTMTVAHAATKLPPHGAAGTNKERTFIMLKPDGVHRNLLGELIRRWEAKGYTLVGLKMVQPDEKLASSHYADLSKKAFFPGLIKFITQSGPVIAMVWEGKGVIKQSRKMLGATNPLDSEPGTMRGDNCVDIGRNCLHGSDSPEAAEEEINNWFRPNEIFERETAHWVYE